jgi:hypothetical protein
MLRGRRPNQLPTRSLSARSVTRSDVRGATARLEASPSVYGHCDTTAATDGSSAATAMTCPPENDEPHSTVREASTPGSVRANATAAAQSCR